jgi:hypothetical protein
MPLLRRLLTSALVVAAASALCVCAALASARPLVAKGHHPRLAIVHRALAPVTGLAPGDSARRKLDLRYRGSGRFDVVVLRVRGSRRSPLRALSTGLRLKIDRCSAAWRRLTRARTYACKGRRSAVLRTVVIGRPRRLKLGHLTPRAGRTDHLLLTLSLPLRAGNALEQRAAKIVYAFTGS